MIADFIGGPWHLCSRPMGEMVSADPPSEIHAVADPASWGVMLPAGFDMTPRESVYRLAIHTPTFCVYVDSAAATWTVTNIDMSDPVRYFFAREVDFQQDVKGWTHNNPDYGLAAADGIRGMMAIMRFRKRNRKT